MVFEKAPDTAESPRSREDFPSLVRKYGEKAYNFAFRLAGNEQDARDLVQQAFLHAFEKFEKYDPSRPFQPWFNRILKNIYLDGVRRYERKHSVSLNGPSPIEDVMWEDIIPGTDSTPGEDMDRAEVYDVVQRALQLLPIHYRMAITLCDIEHYSYDQISEILECPIGTVRSRIHQGRLLLRKTFDELLYKKETQPT
jgi:RNA polymerase sigma-70 factor (ECF subfamily)